jgi:hypothetical protein
MQGVWTDFTEFLKGAGPVGTTAEDPPRPDGLDAQ